MKTAFKCAIALVVAATVGLSMMKTAAGSDQQNFVCEIPRGAVVRIDDMGGSPEYSFGASKDKMLKLPSKSDEVHYGQISFSKGGAGYYRFTNGNYSYVVYDGIGDGWSFTGLLVFKGNKLTLKEECLQVPPPSLTGFDTTKAVRDNDDDINTYGIIP